MSMCSLLEDGRRAQNNPTPTSRKFFKCNNVEKGNANVNAKRDDGMTALFLAAGTNRLEMCEYLISAKADPLAQRNDDGKRETALDRAERKGHKGVCDFLRKCIKEVQECKKGKKISGELNENEENNSRNLNKQVITETPGRISKPVTARAVSAAAAPPLSRSITSLPQLSSMHLSDLYSGDHSTNSNGKEVLITDDNCSTMGTLGNCSSSCGGIEQELTKERQLRASLESDLLAQTTTVQELQKARDKLQADFDKLKQSRAEQENTVISEAKARERELIAKVRSLNAMIKKLEADLDAAAEEAKRDDCKHPCETPAGTTAGMTTAGTEDDAYSEISELRKDIDELMAQLEESKRAHASEVSELNSVMEKQQTAFSKKEEEQKRILTARGKAREAQMEEKLSSTIANIESEHSVELSGLHKKLRHIRQELKTSRLENKELRNRHELDLERLEEKLEEQQQIEAGLRSEQKRMEKDYKVKIKNLAAQITGLKEEIKSVALKKSEPSAALTANNVHAEKDCGSDGNNGGICGEIEEGKSQDARGSEKKSIVVVDAYGNKRTVIVDDEREPHPHHHKSCVACVVS
eukprot:jgi/Bigna1/87584/estExt_fgenesh1_pg.C_220032